MDADMIDMLRGSLQHVLTEATDRPLAERLADLGWDEVLADDEASALVTLFEVRGDTRSSADALGPLLAAALATGLGDESLRSATVALPRSLHPHELSSTVAGSDLMISAVLLNPPSDSTPLLVPVGSAEGVRIASVASAKGLEVAPLAETDETQQWVEV